MLYLSAYFLLLSVFLYLFISQLFSGQLENNMKILKLKQQSLKAAEEKFRRIAEANAQLNSEIEHTQALYELSKDMCRYLDEEKIFSAFKAAVFDFIKIDDCLFVKDQDNTALAEDYRLFPLKIDDKNLGVLAVKNLSDKDSEIFSILTQQYILAIRRAVLYKEVQDLAITDSLTGAFSRRYSMERLAEEAERSDRFKLTFCVLMADIDHFKKYNDHYGHLVGDVILKRIVGLIKNDLRHIDLVARYGGEEFMVLLPETSKENGMLVAERIRSKIESAVIEAYDEHIRVSISIGLANFPEDAKATQELIDKADWALYRSKNTGRNRVCSYKVYKE